MDTGFYLFVSSGYLEWLQWEIISQQLSEKAGRFFLPVLCHVTSNHAHAHAGGTSPTGSIFRMPRYPHATPRYLHATPRGIITTIRRALASQQAEHY